VKKGGALKRIKAEVDWELEISHIAKLVEEKAARHFCLRT